jgi:hypothetical protein
MSLAKLQKKFETTPSTCQYAYPAVVLCECGFSSTSTYTSIMHVSIHVKNFKYNHFYASVDQIQRR